MRPAAFSQRQEAAANLVTANTVGFKAYLERQGRNEFIKLASQIAYDGINIVFVFYENQLRKLMSESPGDERMLEVLRASCIGQPREMVNLFIAPMRSMSMAQQIDKTLDHLRQRYGVSGGLTTEPQIIDIRLGPRVAFDTASLKSYNEDLNALKVFAYAHDEVEKLSGQLLMNVANRLPGVLKRRYLDYLKKLSLDLNRPGFESLRKFVVEEVSIMTSDYAQTFFKSDDKEKSHESGVGRGSVRVRRVAVKAPVLQISQTNKRGPDLRNNSRKNQMPQPTKPPPLCFVCNDSVSKHFLGNCKTFKTFTNERKKRVVVGARRCLNCLTLGHMMRSGIATSKCRRCDPACSSKHAGRLHEVYVRSCVGSGNGSSSLTKVIDTETRGSSSVD